MKRNPEETLNIRVLLKEDVSLYRDLRLEALRENPEAFVTTYEDYVSRPIESVVSQLVPDGDHYTLGAFDAAKQLLGTVTVVRESAAKLRHIASVYAMYVSPPARGQGVGQELLSDLVRRCKLVDGLEQLRLRAVVDNAAAVALYRSMGFKPYGVEMNAIKAPNRSWDEFLMALPLSEEAQLEDSFGQQRGFSHVTLNVSDLETSLRFYIDTLGLKLVHRGRKDAYVEWGEAWICLQERSELSEPRLQHGVDHVALYVPPSEFQTVLRALQNSDVQIVRGPIQRGRGWTVNFLDPDRIQLEFHSGTLADRMKVWE